MRVGILGTGGMGNVHAAQYRKMSDVEIAGADQDAERGQSFSQKWDAPAFASFDELAAWADVIDICLPTDLHATFSLQAIAAGRAVYVEKPLARTLEDARSVIEAAAKANVPLGVGHVVRYFPEFRAAHRSIVAGGIGKPATVRTRRGGAAPKGAAAWFSDVSRSGGVILDLAIHDFDWLRWTFGEVKHLYCRSFQNQYALTVLTFENGTIGHVETTWMDPSGFRTTFEVAGSGGLLHFDSRETPSIRVLTEDGVRVESNLSPTDDPYYRQLGEFLDALRSGSAPPVSGEEGLAALAISLAAMESAETGHVVTPERV